MPPLDPPFDDESAPQTWAVSSDTAQLALDLAPTARAAAGSRPHRPRPSALGGTAGSAGAEHPGDGGEQGGPLPPEAVAAASPEARQAARRFLITCLEIFNGYRPVAHVRQLSSPLAAETISEQLAAAVDRIAGQRPAGRPKELVRLRSLRVCEPRQGVAEAAAALSATGRTWAMAFRLECRGGSWLGTAAEVL